VFDALAERAGQAQAGAAKVAPVNCFAIARPLPTDPVEVLLPMSFRQGPCSPLPNEAQSLHRGNLWRVSQLRRNRLRIGLFS